MRFLIPLFTLVTIGGVASANPRGGHVERGHVERGHVERGHAPRGHNQHAAPAQRGGHTVYRPHDTARAGHGGHVTTYGGHHPSVRHHTLHPQRTITLHRHYDYQRRPAVVAESYSPMTGYVWIAGSWTWDGYEWIWQPGHYEADPAYSGVDVYAQPGQYEVDPAYSGYSYAR